LRSTGFEPRVPGIADAGALGNLLATQAEYSPSAGRRHVELIGRQFGPRVQQEPAKIGSGRHGGDGLREYRVSPGSLGSAYILCLARIRNVAYDWDSGKYALAWTSMIGALLNGGT
jgi:hypothetical protein